MIAMPLRPSAVMPALNPEPTANPTNGKLVAVDPWYNAGTPEVVRILEGRQAVASGASVFGRKQ